MASTGQSLTSLKKREAATANNRDGDQLIITPLGAGNEVGRSCVYMSYKGKTVLVWCSIHTKCPHPIFLLIVSFLHLGFELFFNFFLNFSQILLFLAVWLWDSSGLFRDGCIALLWWNWSFHYWCSSHYSVCFLPYSFTLLRCNKFITFDDGFIIQLENYYLHGKVYSAWFWKNVNRINLFCSEWN